MTARVVVDTLLAALPAFSAQVLVVVAVAAAGALALEHPKARLFFWQGVLLLALLLPVAEPWKAAPVEAITASSAVILHVVRAAEAPASWFSWKWWAGLRWRPEYWLALLAAGALLRLVWIGAGFLLLRRYRKHAQPMREQPFRFLSKNVRWYVSETLPGPVTYGWLHPSILLPRRVEALPAALRDAIACHELVHVRRGDWLFVLGEELVRCLLWFHPAVWFVLSRIQLAREQVVDREAIRLTENRDCYLDALVAVAAHKLQPDLAPAPLFLKKRHLRVRVAEMMKEVSMSRSHITASLTAVFSAALVAARIAVWFFPMVSPAQTVVDDPGITVEAGGQLLHRGPVHYPAGPRVAGTVTLEATLNAKGEVSDARVLDGPAELRRAALGGVLDWHYSTAAAGLVRISIRFDPPAGPGGPRGAQPSPVVPAIADTTTNRDTSTNRIKSIEFVGVSPEAEKELRSRIQVREGDTVNTSDMLRISRAVQEFDSHLRASFTMRAAGDANHDAVLRISLLPQANGSGPRPAPVPPRPAIQTIPAAVPDAPATLRVGGNVQSTKLVKKPVPVYPPLAKQARIQGTVQLTVSIGPDGAVTDVQVISGHPLLVDAAVEAVKQWVYQPTLLNGNPVGVITQVEVNFTLSE